MISGRYWSTQSAPDLSANQSVNFAHLPRTTCSPITNLYNGHTRHYHPPQRIHLTAPDFHYSALFEVHPKTHQLLPW
jgi:hypothetical protein